MTFRDHFSAASDDYARYRPRYPEPLFAWLGAMAPGRAHAVDVATGNGQAATALARHFDRVSAFDASASQIAGAEPAAGVHYAVAPAEALPLPDAGADCLTVAQALHWFDLPRFYAEAQRVLRPGGLLAAWTYNRLTVDPAVDAVIEHLYTDLLGPDWPPERHHVETGYRDLPFPFPALPVPDLAMTADWTVNDLLGYLGTWSATRQHRTRTGADPLALIDTDLRTAFGHGRRTVHWPLAVRAGLR